MLGRPLTPLSVAGVRRRGRRRGLMVGMAAGAAVASRNNQPQQDDYEAEQPVAAQPSADDQMAELEKLGQLKQEGILTDEEFAAKKKQILGI